MQQPPDVYDLKDEDQAKEYLNRVGIEYRFQCYHEKLSDGCHRLGSFLEAMNKDWANARRVFESNCLENRYGPSCFKMGNYNLVGRVGNINQNEALKYYELGCDLKDGPSCHNLALMHQDGKADDQKKDYKKVENYLTKACEYKDGRSCYRLSALYLQGREDVPKNMELAFKYAAIACEHDNPYACANVSRMYKLGEGVQKNLELSEHYRQRAKNLHDSAKERTIASGGEFK